MEKGTNKKVGRSHALNKLTAPGTGWGKIMMGRIMENPLAWEREAPNTPHNLSHERSKQRSSANRTSL